MKERLWHRLSKNSHVTATKHHERMNNRNKIIYLIGDSIGFVRININTCSSGMLLFHMILFMLKFFIKNNPITKINPPKKYDTTALKSLETA